MWFCSGGGKGGAGSVKTEVEGVLAPRAPCGHFAAVIDGYVSTPLIFDAHHRISFMCTFTMLRSSQAALDKDLYGQVHGFSW